MIWILFGTVVSRRWVEWGLFSGAKVIKIFDTAKFFCKKFSKYFQLFFKSTQYRPSPGLKEAGG
jgi:transposase-like protein